MNKPIKKNPSAKSQPVSRDSQAALNIDTNSRLASKTESTEPSTNWRKILLGVVLLAIYIQISFIYIVPLKDKIKITYSVHMIKIMGERNQIDQKGAFIKPISLSVDNINKRLCLVDGGFNKILIWNLQDGSHIIDLDSQAAEKQAFTPRAGAFDHSGNLYVLDQINHEVTIFSPDYELLHSWQVIRFCVAMSVNKETRNVYILDRQCNIAVYDFEGEEIFRFRGKVLLDPINLAVDLKGRIYVVDRRADKIQIFNSKGKLLKSLKTPFAAAYISSICLSQGNILLTNTYANEILVLSRSGRVKQILKEKQERFTVMVADNLGHIYLDKRAGIHQYKKRFQIKIQRTPPEVHWATISSFILAQIRADKYLGWAEIPFTYGILQFPLALTTAFLNDAVLSEYESSRKVIILTSILLLIVLSAIKTR